MTTYCTKLHRDERGIALVAALLVALAVSAIAVGAAMLAINTTLVQKNSARTSVLDGVALQSLEEVRSELNGNTALYPVDSGYTTVFANAPAIDADGRVIPNVKRSAYVGPAGITSGQYGIFGSIIAVAEDSFGNRSVQRLEVNQESFAKFAYFTDVEPSNISFGCNDVLYGPVHTNDNFKMYAPCGSSKATFKAEVRTAKTVNQPSYGQFDRGFTEHVPRIEMPTITDINKLKTQALAGNTYVLGDNAGGTGEASLRILFVPVDINLDGDFKDENEGFMMIYRGNDTRLVAAMEPGGSSRIKNSKNCGHVGGSHPGLFMSINDHPSSGSDNKFTTFSDANAACYLGGDPVLTNGFVPNNADGAWLPWAGWGGGPPAAIAAGLMPNGAPVGAMASYLWPINRPYNPSFKGVIFAEGKVGISGRVRSRVTVVSPQDIIIMDDLSQETDPASVPNRCEDIVGLVAGQDVVVSNNTINTPINYPSTSSWQTLDPDGGRDEVIQAVVLALDQFWVQDYSSGPTNREICETTPWGRGCLYLTGGIIQKTRGAVGTTAGTGYLKRYSYNTCAYTSPPPYFPTTGHFAKNRIYRINPVGFGVASWYQTYQVP